MGGHSVEKQCVNAIKGKIAVQSTKYKNQVVKQKGDMNNDMKCSKTNQFLDDNGFVEVDSKSSLNCQEKISNKFQINFKKFDQLAQGYWDWHLPLLLRYRFPLDFPKDKREALCSSDNHT